MAKRWDSRSMAKKEIWDKVTWHERRMREKKERKNESLGIHRNSIFDTPVTVRKILTRQF